MVIKNTYEVQPQKTHSFPGNRVYNCSSNPSRAYLSQAVRVNRLPHVVFHGGASHTRVPVQLKNSAESLVFRWTAWQLEIFAHPWHQFTCPHEWRWHLRFSGQKFRSWPPLLPPHCYPLCPRAQQSEFKGLAEVWKGYMVYFLHHKGRKVSKNKDY